MDPLTTIPMPAMQPGDQPVPTGPAVAQDTDVIEPEWVAKAEQIVADTRQNPYEQANALNALKADYMKKRYGKDVKVVNG